MENEIRVLVQEAIESKVFPGSVVLVGDKKKVDLLRAYGTTMYDDPGSKKVETEMLFDIASITKAFTATLTLIFLDENKLALDDYVVKFIPEFAGQGREIITIWHLLTHSSGLKLAMSSVKDFPSSEIRDRVLADVPTTQPGSQVYYSNVNSMLLAEVMTRISKRPFIEVMKEKIIDPLSLSNTMFNPPKSFLERIVPTEHDSWRMRLIRGEVHDESAYSMGGITGHAGLFSTASDLWKFAQVWINNGLFQGKVFLKNETVALASSLQIQTQTGGQGLGWKIADTEWMGEVPSDTYGHTGFTGTSITICPSKNKIFVFLTNRIYPKRGDKELINLVRRDLHELILK